MLNGEGRFTVRAVMMDFFTRKFGAAACAILVTATVGLFGAAAPAAAGPNVCAEQSVVAKRLKNAFSEEVALTGKTRSNYLVQVFAADDFKTWTLTVAKRNGPTCLLASGKGESQLTRRLAKL